MKKIIFIVLSLFICLNLTACKNNIDTSKNLNYKEIEQANKVYDKQLIEKTSEVYNVNIKNAKTDEEKQVVTIKYIDDIYKIASNRVNLDLEILMVFSDSYKDYVEKMKLYSEIYLTERGNLIKNKSLTSKDSIMKTTTGEALSNILKLL